MFMPYMHVGLPVTVVGTSAPAGSTTTVTLAWPAGHQAGDVAIIYLCAGTSAYTVPALPSGCTDIGSLGGSVDAGTTAGNGAALRVCYLIATSGAMADLTIADHGAYTIAAMTVYRNVDNTSPILASSVVEGPPASNAATKSAQLAPVSGIPASSAALLIFGMGDALGTTSNTFGTEVVDTMIDTGTYEGTLWAATGWLSDPDSTVYTVTRATTAARNNFVSAWVIPRPLP